MAKSKAKGLKGALARHLHQEQLSKRLAEKQANKEKVKTKKPHHQAAHKPKHPWDDDDKILLVGEGDFSFALSIINQGYVLPTNLIATSFDSLDVLKQKYAKVEEILGDLTQAGVRVVHDVDATKLGETLNIKKNPIHVGVVLFNFPHTGKGIKDQDRNVRDHQVLVSQYFASAKQLLVSGATEGYFKENWRIMLSLFDGEPYISWQVKALAREHNLIVDRSTKFAWDQYPGYHHRRTNSMRDTTKPSQERDARTYVFVERPERPERATKEE